MEKLQLLEHIKVEIKFAENEWKAAKKRKDDHELKPQKTEE